MNEHLAPEPQDIWAVRLERFVSVVLGLCLLLAALILVGVGISAIQGIMIIGIQFA